MTILESIGAYYRITCALCLFIIEINATGGTRFEFARTLMELGWTTVDGVVLCPDCRAKWRAELKGK